MSLCGIEDFEDGQNNGFLCLWSIIMDFMMDTQLYNSDFSIYQCMHNYWKEENVLRRQIHEYHALKF